MPTTASVKWCSGVGFTRPLLNYVGNNGLCYPKFQIDVRGRISKYWGKWTTTDTEVDMCSGNHLDNFHLHRFTISENMANFWGLIFTHTVCTWCIRLEWTLNSGLRNSASRNWRHRSMVWCTAYFAILNRWAWLTSVTDKGTLEIVLQNTLCFMGNDVYCSVFTFQRWQNSENRLIFHETIVTIGWRVFKDTMYIKYTLCWADIETGNWFTNFSGRYLSHEWTYLHRIWYKGNRLVFQRP